MGGGGWPLLEETNDVMKLEPYLEVSEGDVAAPYSNVRSALVTEMLTSMRLHSRD
jgi:hypothetical protein